MIEVQKLTKAFGAVRAVDDVSFTVGKGEILGFLGPNGAGKTTTMRVLTGYLPATSGTAKIAGYDVHESSLEVRRRIGYLPENPPLYPDMSVASYLDFVARIKGVAPAERAGRVNAALEMASITDKRKELIKRLSKGYKQRVGLAQALVHNPDVIILDEPTIGLDPKQIIEVRHLIKSLAGNHTIILSTHILPEVSMTCDRVVIINKGHIVAMDTTAGLTAQLRGGEKVLLEVHVPRGKDKSALHNMVAGLAGVRSVQTQALDGTGRYRVEAECEKGHDVRSALAARIVSQGYELFELRSVRLSLEEIFLQLTTSDEIPAAEGTKR
ncbi:MAG: ABC transporter ATP-binding protein [Acidobacteria bacterium]|nr:ABC transporter ATP-binding protein [Acidobacteriota bacterium]